MSRTYPEATSAKERAANVESLRRVPLSAFSSDPIMAAIVRSALIARAAAGEEVYAYTVGPSHRWVIWLWSGNPANDDRWTPEQWAAHYLAESGVR